MEFFDGQELGAFEDSLVVLVAAIAQNERHGVMKISYRSVFITHKAVFGPDTKRLVVNLSVVVGLLLHGINIAAVSCSVESPMSTIFYFTAPVGLWYNYLNLEIRSRHCANQSRGYIQNNSGIDRKVQTLFCV